MTVLDYIRRWHDECPQKVAVICGDTVLTYRELYDRMLRCEDIPVPLLADSWDSDFCLYTTGTTGQSKGVVISQKAVIANSHNLIDSQGFTHNLVFIVVGQLEHLGSWSKFFPVFFVGGTVLILQDGLRDMDSFFSALDMKLADYGLPQNTRFASFLVPTNIRLLLQFGSDRLAQYADRIDFVETGAAPIPHSDMIQLCRILPATRLYNTYASTETGIVCTYNFNDGKIKPGCVGKPMPRSQVSVAEDGRVICRGETLMTGYRDDVALTQSVMHDGAVYTADRGFFDQDGMLHLEGRMDDILNVGGFKVNPLEVEEVALQYDGVRDCLCTTSVHPVLGNVLTLKVQMQDGYSLDKRSLARHINCALERYKVPQIYEQVDSIPRTFNGKMIRS